MKYGLSEAQLREIINFIAQYPEVETAVLFGSRALGTYKEASDVDIALQGEKVNFSLAAKMKFDIEEDTYLPFFFDFIAYPGITNDALKKHIDTHGICIYGKGAGMSGMLECKLGDVIKFGNGKSRPSSEGAIPIYGGNGILGYTVDANYAGETIVIGRVGAYCGATYYEDQAIWVSDNALAAKPKDQNNAKYLFYFLRNMDLNQHAQGSSHPLVTQTLLNSIDIEIIENPDEQKAIASVLSSLDDKIDLLHRQNKTLEAMAETLFRQWFVEEAQEDWKEGNLGYFAVNPKDGVKPSDIDSETKYIGLEHIDRRSVALIQSGNASDVTSNKFLFAEDDILFGKLRPYFHKVCFAPYSGVCSTDILVIRPKKPDYFAYCLFAFYQSAVVEYANIGSGGTRMPRTNWETLSQYPVSVSDDMKLREFNDLVVPSINKIKQNIVQIHMLEKLRDTLLPKLMSGEVRVDYEHEGARPWND